MPNISRWRHIQLSETFQLLRSHGTKGLVTNYREGGGGFKTGGGGAHEVLPLRKGGGGSFSHAKGGGGTTNFGVVFTW